MPAADRIRDHEGDNRPTTHDASHRILAEQHRISNEQHDTTHSAASQRAATAAHSAALVQSHTLPDLQIHEHDAHSALQIHGHDAQSTPHENGFTHFVHGAEAVASDVARGAVDEIVHHPDQVIASAATGLLIGTAAVLLAPEVAAVATAGCLAVGALQVINHAGQWIHDTEVVFNPQGHTQADVARAHQGVQNIGGQATLAAAGAIGGAGGGSMAGAVRSAMALPTAEALTSRAAAAQWLQANPAL